MKTIIPVLSFILTIILFSCNSSEETKEKKEETKDSSATDEAELPLVDEMEMEYMYEITHTKTKKVQMMSQEEYLESGIWENPDVMIKEVPVVK